MLLLAALLLIATGCESRAVPEQATSPKPSFFDNFNFGPHITVNKFPPVIELIVQRIQMQFSNYVHEDLSRPSTYDRPIYTLPPEEQTEPPTTTTTTTSAPEQQEDDDDYDSPTIAEALIKPPILILIENFEVENLEDSLAKEIQQSEDVVKKGGTFNKIREIVAGDLLGFIDVQKFYKKDEFYRDKPEVLVAFNRVNGKIMAHVIEVKKFVSDKFNKVK